MHMSDGNKISLSTLVVDGLRNLCFEMTPELVKQTLLNSVQLTLETNKNNPAKPDLDVQNIDKVKQIEYAVVTLYALATKYGLTNLELRQLLEEHEIKQEVLEELIKTYDNNREDFILRQLNIGQYLPMVTDVQWRMLTDVKSSTSTKGTGDVHFNINLGRYVQKNGERETIVEFICNPEEMQFLISKLKEIQRECNKIAKE